MRNKKDELVRILRSRITDGVYRPGERLPTRVELEREFGVSSKTLQLALDELIREHYVEARGKRGSFVTADPPHLTRICLFFEESFEEEVAGNRLFQAIAEARTRVEQSRRVRFELIDRAREFRWAGKLEELLADVRARRLAGIFFLAVPAMLEATPILEDPAIPRVALAAEVSLIKPVLYPDYLDFHQRALTALREARCRRPALLLDTLTPALFLTQLQELIRSSGWPLRGEDLQQLPTGHVRLVRNLVRLMFQRPERERPDGLVVCNDNVLDTVCSELEALGWRGTAPRVVALANFPISGRRWPGVIRIGFEPDRILELATDCILSQLRGERLPARMLFPALTEAEAAVQQKRRMKLEEEG